VCARERSITDGGFDPFGEAEHVVAPGQPYSAKAQRARRGARHRDGCLFAGRCQQRRLHTTNFDQVLERSDFGDVADVLNALQEQDDDLIAILRELQEAKGRGEVFNPKRLAEKIEVLGPTIELSNVKVLCPPNASSV
jgi:hypothetical protein